MRTLNLRKKAVLLHLHGKFSNLCTCRYSATHIRGQRISFQQLQQPLKVALSPDLFKTAMTTLSLCIYRYSSSHIDSLVRADDVAALGLVYERLRKRFRTHRFALEDSIRTICKKANVAWTRALAKTLEGLERLAKAEKDGLEKEDGLAGADKEGLGNRQEEDLGLAEKEHSEKARQEGSEKTEPTAGLIEKRKEGLERPQEGCYGKADTKRVEGRQNGGSEKAEEGTVETTAENISEGTQKEDLEKESETEELTRLDGAGSGKIQEECFETATEAGLGTDKFGSERAKTGRSEGSEKEELAKVEGQDLSETPEHALAGARGLEMEQGLRDAEPDKGAKKLEARQGLVGAQEGGSGAAPERQVEGVEKSHVALLEADTKRGEKRKRAAEEEAQTELRSADPRLERGDQKMMSTPGPLPSTAEEGTSSKVAKKSRSGEPGVDEVGGDMETREGEKGGEEELGGPTAQVPPGGGPVAGDDVSSPPQLLRVTSAGGGGRDESPAAGTRRSRRSVEGGVETPGRTAPPPRTLAPRCNSRKQSELGEGGRAQGQKTSTEPAEKEAPKEQAMGAQNPSAREKEGEFKAQATPVLRSALAMYRDSVSGLAPVLSSQSPEGKVKSEPYAEGGLPGAGRTEGRGEAERMLLRAFTLVHGREAAGVEEVLRLHEDVVKVKFLMFQ